MLSGLLAAAVTPLTHEGAALDAESFAPLVAFLRKGGVDGLLVLGTTGEGILLSIEERKRAAELFLKAAREPGDAASASGGEPSGEGPRPSRFQVAVHCGAQTTADTAALAAHAADSGADAVAVIGPPYYAYDEIALLRHFLTAARACAPLPFYAYEFAARAGYSLPATLLGRLRDEAPNLRGIKISNRAWDRVEPYLLEGLDAFIGYEPWIGRGLSAGAAGSVSGLATAFPEIVAHHLRNPDAEGAESLSALRAALEEFPFVAAAKQVLVDRGVAIRPDVRAPLRTLDENEKDRLRRAVSRWNDPAPRRGASPASERTV